MKDKNGFKNLFRFSFLLIAGIVFSQQPAGMKDTALWIKANRDTIISQSPIGQLQKELFNFNPIFENKNGRLVYKNILANRYSLFIVFRSDLDQETSLISLKTFDDKIDVSNRKAGDKTAINYKNASPKNGMVLSYMVSSDKKVKSKANIFSILNLSAPNSPKGQKNELIELLYYPRLLTKTEQERIETYLSLKYGISLLGEADYLSSDSKKIWDYNENKSYNNRITGLARDDYFGLYQKQSGNSLKDGLFIGLKNIALSNQANSSTMADKTYILWGDNNGSKEFDFNDNMETEFKSIKRIWKMQITSPSQEFDTSTQMVLDKNIFSFGSDIFTVENDQKYIWLVVCENEGRDFDYQNAQYFKAKEEDTRLIFDNLRWDTDKSGSDFFTFIKAPDFFVAYRTTAPNCKLSDKGKLDVNIVGGFPPFKVDITSTKFNFSVLTNERIIQIPEMPVDEYKIVIKDNFRNQTSQEFKLNPFMENSVTLDPEWQLNPEGSTKLAPKVAEGIEEGMTYKWHYDGLVVSTEKELETDKPGEYLLIVTNKQGCEKELICTLKNSNQKLNWSVYPNPTVEKQPFTIDFSLEKTADVYIAIYDITNRLVCFKDLGTIKDFEYKDSLPTSGIYMVVVTINGKTESAKLIIR